MNEDTPNPSAIRCFVALPLPAEVKETLIRERNRLETAVGRGAVRWVGQSQMHLTLRFFGNILESQRGEITEALANMVVATTPFRLETGPLGRFPEGGQPRVIWLGLGGDLGALKRVQQALDQGTRSWGDHQESKPFQPHLTLGRVKTTRLRELDALGAAMKARPGEAPKVWTAAAIEFIQSTLTSTGPAYRALATLPLGGAAGGGNGLENAR